MEKADKRELKIIQNKLASFSSIDQLGEKELIELYDLFSLLFEIATDISSIQFTSLFSRIVYAAVDYKIPARINFYNHAIRKIFEGKTWEDKEIEPLFHLLRALLWHDLYYIADTPIPEEYSQIDKGFLDEGMHSRPSYQRILQTVIVDVQSSRDANSTIQFYAVDAGHKLETAIIEDMDFSKQILKFKAFVRFPMPANLIDLTEKEGQKYVKAVVVQPDFLVGITSISECFQYSGDFALSYLVRKLIPSPQTIHLLMGNAVNQLFDALMHSTEQSFRALSKDIFSLAPVEFCKMNDTELRDFLAKLSLHYEQLKKTISEELSQLGIGQDKAFLEPSFYSQDYGIQGRLDLYHFDSMEERSDIIELKSGKLFRPNRYGLNENHYMQTLLYDLLMESVHQAKVKSRNYILYSSLAEGRLRFAPRLRKKQLRALYLRNEIIFIENILVLSPVETVRKMLNFISPEKIPAGFNFVKRDAEVFYAAYRLLSGLEEKYYILFLQFLSREYHLSKTGLHGTNAPKGLAALWLEDLDSKAENFNILSFLKIKENRAGDREPQIEMILTERSPRLSRFRKGDIVVLYPHDNHLSGPLQHQIIKCTITELAEDRLTLRLRARQKNNELFDNYSYWHIEPDILDSSFNKQFHGLFKFIRSTPDYRRKILCLEAPQNYQASEVYINSELTEEQNRIVNKAIASQDYYLLWGPPGTGKTSVVIKALMDYYYNSTSKNVLLLAYTNRAVDEICSSIEAVVGKNYIRIGSRYSTKAEYHEVLLRNISEICDSRQSLKDKIVGTRVYVSTLSSFHGKSEIMDLVDFDLVIIDEASQILEPMLVGLLSSFSKFILIGDHKQLPAVVVQDSGHAEIEEELKQATGLCNPANSLFERMYSQCIKNQWEWAFDGLSLQGRMHRDILDFVSPNFYDSHLFVLSKLKHLESAAKYDAFDELSEILIKNRMIFVDVPPGADMKKKTNEGEAILLSLLVEKWVEIYAYNKRSIEEESIGIITPFRSQIAIIMDKFNSQNFGRITVDTVERYQGGARNQIIISLAVSQAEMLESISNVSEAGIDRKLNVALTRARENVVIFGNKSLLSKKAIYRKLIAYCFELNRELIK